MPTQEPPPQIASALEEGETVVWSGRPAVLPYVLGGMVLSGPLGLIALVSAASWTHNEEVLALPLWTKAVLLLVLVFAAHMLLLRPLLGVHIARRTAYAITDRRSLVVCDAFGGRTQQLLHDQGRLVAVRGPGDFGKIKFGHTASSSADVLLFGRAAVPGFYGLSDVDQPLDVLRGLREVD